jgi:hypothetical protein
VDGRLFLVLEVHGYSKHLLLMKNEYDVFIWCITSIISICEFVILEQTIIFEYLLKIYVVDFKNITTYKKFEMWMIRSNLNHIVPNTV